MKSGAKRKVGREKWGKEKVVQRKSGAKSGMKSGARKMGHEKSEVGKVGQRKSGA